MILLQDTSWGAGRVGSPTGNSYEIDRVWQSDRGLGFGFWGDEIGDGVGMDGSIESNYALLYRPIPFEHLVINAALSLTWRDK